MSLLRLWIGRGTALGKAERPLDTAQDVSLVLMAQLDRVFAVLDVWRVTPQVFTMAKARVEDLALAIHTAPGNGCVFSLGWILGWMAQVPQGAYLGAVLAAFLHLVHFFLRDVPCGTIAAIGRMSGITSDKVGGHLLAMIAKFALQHVYVTGPALHIVGMQGIAAAMHAHEGMAIFDPLDETVAIRQGKWTRGIGKDHSVDLLGKQIGGAETLKGFLLTIGHGLLLGLRVGLHFRCPLRHLGLILFHVIGVALLGTLVRIRSEILGLAGCLGHLDVGLLDEADDRESARVLAQLFDGLLCKRNRAMTEASRDGAHQHSFGFRCCGE